MNTVTVSASRRYDIQIGSGLLETLGAVCQSVCPGRAAALIADDNVDRLYGGQAADSLRRAGFSVSKFVFPNGEGSKNLAVLGDALEFLAERGLTRADLVVALGGGVTGDLGGFAASVYQRGIRFVQVPTTLLAMIDSSVGGKTAVNLAHGKNLAGSFYQPSAVLCDHSLLATLSPEIYADGVAEAVKYGAAFDCELFFRLLERRRQPENRMGDHPLRRTQARPGRAGRTGRRRAAVIKLRPHRRPCD